jgi:hypothetical protein
VLFISRNGSWYGSSIPCIATGISSATCSRYTTVNGLRAANGESAIVVR